MNRIKPTRIEVEEIEVEEQKIKPQRFENVDIAQSEEELEELGADKKITKKRYKLKLFIVAIILFFGLFIYDVSTHIIEIYNENLFFGTFFGIVGVIFLFLVIKSILKELKSFRNLKKIEIFHLKSKKLKISPSKESILFVKELINFYKKSAVDEIQSDLKKMEQDLKEENFLYSEVVELFEKNILSKLDKKSHNIVNRYVLQSSIATTLSPIAILDALFVIWRNVAMMGEIARIYGFTPSLIFKISLAKQILQSVIFASVAEIMSEYGTYIIGNSLISKISINISDGIANGILTARIGYNTIEACRPIYNKDDKKSKLRNSISQMIKKIVG